MNNETEPLAAQDVTDKNQKRRILVADDDPAILRLVSAILEKENYGVVAARDGREAYKILQNDPNFTAAIFDVVMPHISGPELVRYMTSQGGRRKVMFGSNYPMIAPGAALADLDALQLDDEIRELFLAGNARRVFGLDAAAR